MRKVTTMSAALPTAKRVCVTALILSTGLLTACRDTNQYLGRRDTIKLGAGDAMAHNRAVHTIDPWPAHSKDTDIPMDGKRAMVGIKRYQENRSIEPEGEDTTERFEEQEGGPPAAPPS